MSRANKGLAPVAAAYVIWGVLPLYFHVFREVPSAQVIAHRIAWSCLFILGWMAARGELSGLRAALADRGLVARLAVTAALISANWMVYVWAVAHDRIVETSLGYFIGPLVNVSLGVVILSERLTRAQWTAIVLAAVGVTYLTAMSGGLPWISLTLAFAFAIYGLIRKIVKVDALPGLAIETLVLFPFAVVFLLWSEATGTGAFGHDGGMVTALLIGSGPITAISLFLYAYGTRLLPYSTVGLLQYIAPTLQFVCGVFVLHERFDHTRAIGFTIIWVALGIYAVEGIRLARVAADPEAAAKSPSRPRR